MTMMLSGQSGQPVPAAANDDLIFDASTMDFEDRVMRASMETPVLADFWAPWCGPCKQLGPLLEQAVKNASGKIKLAKINIDENPELAQALRIQSVPTVFAFFQGQPVHAFMGAKPQSEIKMIIDQLVKLATQGKPGAIDIPQILESAAQALSEGALEQAQGLYVQILSEDENNAPAYAGLIRTFIAAGEIEHALEMIAQVPETIAADPQFAAARTALELAQGADKVSASDFAAFEEKLTANPADHQTRFDLAMALFAAGQKERAIDELIEIIRRERKWSEDKARLQLLTFFEALGFPILLPSKAAGNYPPFCFRDRSTAREYHQKQESHPSGALARKS